MNNDIYDIIIIGGGPGGYTAALYAARAGLKAIVLEKLSAGGQMALTEQIDNYPGFENSIDGFSLGEKMRMCAEKFGAITQIRTVIAVDLLSEIKRVETDKGDLYAKTIILATGANPRELGLEGEQELIGKGVGYCALCDGMFYRNKTVVVVGGGNSAVEDALILSRICKSVILVHRRDALRATKINQDAVKQANNITFRWCSKVVELISDEKLTGVKVLDLNTNIESIIDCDGIFISAGRIPATEFVNGQLQLDATGYVVADESTRTNVPGVFAIGDVRTKVLRQIVTAVSDGAVSVHYAEEYLAEKYSAV